MRACLLPGMELSPGVDVKLVDERFHHVVQVCRLRPNDEVLLLNGNGEQARAVLVEVSKRSATLKVVGNIELMPKSAPLDVVIAVPKKDALELMLKMGTELGLRRIFLIRSAYSQERLPDPQRIEALIHSALEQSNNPWLPILVFPKSWRDIPWSDYQHVFCFDPSGSTGADLTWKADDGILTLIGPEGGFAPEELTIFTEQKNLRLCRWETPILRAPTALAMAVGWVTARRG